MTGAAIDEARRLGYLSTKVDTLPSIMPNAVQLYRDLGFAECAPYYNNPIPDSVYVQRAL